MPVKLSESARRTRRNYIISQLVIKFLFFHFFIPVRLSGRFMNCCTHGRVNPDLCLLFGKSKIVVTHRVIVSIGMFTLIGQQAGVTLWSFGL